MSGAARPYSSRDRHVDCISTHVVLVNIGLFWIAPNFERVLSALFGVVVLFPILTTVAVFCYAVLAYD